MIKHRPLLLCLFVTKQVRQKQKVVQTPWLVSCPVFPVHFIKCWLDSMLWLNKELCLLTNTSDWPTTCIKTSLFRYKSDLKLSLKVCNFLGESCVQIKLVCKLWFDSCSKSWPLCRTLCLSIESLIIFFTLFNKTWPIRLLPSSTRSFPRSIWASNPFRMQTKVKLTTVLKKTKQVAIHFLTLNRSKWIAKNK